MRIAFILMLAIATGTGIACRRTSQDEPPHPEAALAAARAFQEDYQAILSQAWAGDSAAVGALFGFEDQGAFSGAAAVEHHQVLCDVLAHIGDARFAASARGVLPRVRKAVLNALVLQRGTSFLAQYPQTRVILESSDAP